MLGYLRWHLPRYRTVNGKRGTQQNVRTSSWCFVFVFCDLYWAGLAGLQNRACKRRHGHRLGITGPSLGLAGYMLCTIILESPLYRRDRGRRISSAVYVFHFFDIKRWDSGHGERSLGKTQSLEMILDRCLRSTMALGVEWRAPGRQTRSSGRPPRGPAACTRTFTRKSASSGYVY